MSSINPESQSMAQDHKKNGHGSHKQENCVRVIEVVLRFTLFLTALAPVILLATSKQTVFFRLPFPPYGMSVSAKFTTMPALVYEISALSVACLYSIITGLLALFSFMKGANRSAKLTFTIFVMDLLLVGIVAAAAGAGGEAAYIGLRGNKAAKWPKICTVYDTFCLHVGFSCLISSFAAMTLISLIVLYVLSLSP
ncbi:hypothetical protein DCAR_0935497 [Daucus carota subsp. sativus]|uniref:CASP-like protein n=1 Tax=Daucus carota subsp. sativus TaxID=79200 RepID=A0AAF1BDQ3_DAUCS|nr:PREDICTED: CASP-like protein 1 [Daucus carota subsp. sativus]WOH15949.1 hypothetical protein DCAR_0935497 [Daucus carota subsp. sativus]